MVEIWSLLNSKEKLYKWKNILRSRHFRSSFCITFLFTTIIFAVGGIVIAFQSRLKLQETLEMKADYAALAVQEYLSNVKNSAVFIGNLYSVDRLLDTKSPSLEQLSRMINDVTPYSSIYSYESICVFFERSERIFDSSGGMYNYDDFYNQKLLDYLGEMHHEETWLVNVPYERYYMPRPAVPVVMYIRRLPLYSSEGQGFVTVAYSLKKLQSIASNALSSIPYTASITFQGQLLWSSSSSIAYAWDNSISPADNEAVLFPEQESFTSFKTMDTNCSFYVSNRQFAAAAWPLLSHWLLIYPVAVVAIFAASVLYSRIMLRPVDAIMRKIGIIPYTESPAGSSDEFSLLSTALDNMNAQMSGIKTLMHENQQLVRERLLVGILHNDVNIAHLPPEYEYHGITFPYPFYAIILLSLPSLDTMEDYTKREQLKLLIRTNTTSAFSVLGSAYGLYIDNKSICIILNTSRCDSLQEELFNICNALKKRMKQSLSVYPLFSVGICSEKDPQPWQAWQLARRNVIFTAADADDFILFGFQNEFTSSVDPDLISCLTQSIIDKDRHSLNELAENFRNRYLNETETEEGRRISIIALCSIYASLLDVNVDLPDSPLSTAIRKLESASTMEECIKSFYSSLFGIMNAKNKISIETRSYIQKAVNYIEQSYAQPVTIPQIAEYVGVSPIYLTKIFKLSTGKTLSEYLNYYRTQCSLEMLTETDENINEICEKVGYSDVRSYIRFFKKFYHMTPSEYRKQHIE